MIGVITEKKAYVFKRKCIKYYVIVLYYLITSTELAIFKY